MRTRRGELVATELERLGRMARDWASAGDREGDQTTGHEGLPGRALIPADPRPSDARRLQWLAIEGSLHRRARVVVRRRFMGAAAIALTAVAALMLVRGLGGPEDRLEDRSADRSADRKLSYVVSGGMAPVGSPVQPAQIPVRMSFSDGSHVVMQPGARGAVIGTTMQGARVRLEEGRARFTVAHRPKTSWSVEAGPFTVIVHGTVFDVTWSRDSGALAVDLLVGSVTVEGPVHGSAGTGTVTLMAGQRLMVRTATGQGLIEQLPRGPDSAAPAPDPLPAAPPPHAPQANDAGGGVGSAPTRRPARSASAVAGLSASWAGRVASGAFQGVVDEADAIGVELCLARASAGSLAALADAARYVRRTDLAREALLAERRRFAGSVGAHDAAFLIGRLAEDTSGDLREALHWYDRYLEQGQRGTYASEALGRKMLALDRLGEAADARVTAERYLLAYPAGAFAARARRIQSLR